MCIDSLVQAIQRYLDAQITAEGPSAAAKACDRKGVVEARRHLHDELYNYCVARSHEPSFHRILVAVNDTAPASWAVDVASRLADELRGELAIVHVAEPPHPIPTEVGWIDVADPQRPLREGKELLRRARWRVPARIAVQRFLRQGDAAQEIRSVAEEWNADLIVIGTHGRGRVSNLLFGSTANAVSRLVPCPVLTVAHAPSPSRRVKALLNSCRIQYTVVAHEPEFTAMETAAAARLPGSELAKTTIVEIDGQYAMVVLPATHKVDLELLRLANGGRKVAIAAEHEFTGLFPDCELGAMPPFGNLYGMKVYVADVLSHNEQIAFNDGTHSELIQMAYNDFESLVRPTVIAVTEPVAAGQG